MVDQVCLHDAKIKHVEHKYQTQLDTLDPEQDKEEYDVLTAAF